MSTVKLFDLEFLKKPSTVISPNVAKIRYVLKLKKIPFEVEWVNLGTIADVLPKITNLSTRPQVPVIVDHSNDKVVVDSWDIALYLEEMYPEHSLFHQNIGVHKFFQNYTEQNILPIIFKLIAVEMCAMTGPPELQQKFRQVREAPLRGMTLEQFAGNEQDVVPVLKQALVPVHNLLQTFPYITGHQIGWADIILASHFTLLQGVKPELFQTNVLDDEIIRSWWDRMEKLGKNE